MIDMHIQITQADLTGDLSNLSLPFVQHILRSIWLRTSVHQLSMMQSNLLSVLINCAIHRNIDLTTNYATEKDIEELHKLKSKCDKTTNIYYVGDKYRYKEIAEKFEQLGCSMRQHMKCNDEHMYYFIHPIFNIIVSAKTDFAKSILATYYTQKSLDND